MENQKNEELALYCIKGIASNELYPTIALSEKEVDSHVETYYDTLGITRDDYKKVTDLIVIKNITAKRHDYYEDTNTDYNISDNFEKKVDEKLIEHICEKYYSGYENAEKDQEFFKQSKVAYDDNGFIKEVQAIGDNGWLDILTEKNIDGLDTLFKNEYFAKKHNLYELCDLLDDGLGTCERRAGFFSKDEIKDFIAKDETGVATRAYEYKIYNSDGDVTEALKNEVRNELLNQSPEKLVKNDEFSFMIKVSPIEEGFDKEIKKFCDEHNLFGKVWQGDEAKHFTRFMSETIDKQVWENAISQNKIPTSKVKLEVNFNSGESVNIDVPLGKRLFENADIQKLISVSQKELSVNQISDETARNWNELMRKNEKGEYVTKVNNHTLENMFNGGMEGLAKSAQSIGDEHLTAFVQGFASAYGFSKVAPTQEKVFDKNAEKQPNLAEKIDNLTQTVANQSKENSQEKQSKKSSEITQDEMNAIKEETNKVGNEVLNKGKKPKDKNISKPTDISM